MGGGGVGLDEEWGRSTYVGVGEEFDSDGSFIRVFYDRETHLLGSEIRSCTGARPLIGVSGILRGSFESEAKVGHFGGGICGKEAVGAGDIDKDVFGLDVAVDNLAPAGDGRVGEDGTFFHDEALFDEFLENHPEYWFRDGDIFLPVGVIESVQVAVWAWGVV